jgi:hypothetical protein
MIAFSPSSPSLAAVVAADLAIFLDLGLVR